SRLAQRIVPAVAMGMHVGIILLQNIVFWDLILMPLVFYNFSGVRKALGRRLAARRPMEVLYDGSCPICRRTVRVFTSLDILRRLEFRDFRRVDLTTFERTHGVRLTSQDLEEEMYVISRGQAYGGFCAYRTMALALPVFWPLVPLLYLPGVAGVG